MGKQTPFYEKHLKANAKMVDFAGWEMPLHYGSQLNEHFIVRKDAGVFDVSHMGIVDVSGKDANNFLRFLLANDVNKISAGRAIYTCMLNETGGVIDDLIVYELSPDTFRIVVNAGRRSVDLSWIFAHHVNFDVKITERDDLCMLAIQGPKAKDKITNFINEKDVSSLHTLKPFHFVNLGQLMIARTGYTGEDGFELIFPISLAEVMWDQVLAAFIVPCGLGARDTLRLEAGLNLYGTDMDENVSPYEANLAWTVALDPPDRKFIGRSELERLRQEGVQKKLVGLILDGPGIIRNHQKVMIGEEEGEVTSGGYSPTLQKSIALARIPINPHGDCFVLIRDKKIPAIIVKPPFVRYGQVAFKNVVEEQ